MSEESPVSGPAGKVFIAVQVLFLIWFVYEAFDSGWGSLSSEVGVVTVLIVWGLVNLLFGAIHAMRRTTQL